MNRLTDSERTKLLSYLVDGSYKTSDPWHSYIKGTERIFQWGIIQDRDRSDPSHLTIIFESSDRAIFEAKRVEAETLIVERGRGL